jgi:hypothetical protein
MEKTGLRRYFPDSPDPSLIHSSRLFFYIYLSMVRDIKCSGRPVSLIGNWDGLSPQPHYILPSIYQDTSGYRWFRASEFRGSHCVSATINPIWTRKSRVKSRLMTADYGRISQSLYPAPADNARCIHAFISAQRWNVIFCLPMMPPPVCWLFW